MRFSVEGRIREIRWAIWGYGNYIKPRFRKKHGYPLNLENPRTFSEKIQWIKVNGHLERFSKYTDKYIVRDYVREKVGPGFVVPVLGVCDRFSDIDLKSLPKSFVIKTTHSSGWNVVVKDKTEVDWRSIGKRMNHWVRSSYYRKTGEANYKPLRGRILIEKYLEDPSGDLKDYKFFCFGGEPRFIQVDCNRYTDHRRDIYDSNWYRLPLRIYYANLSEPMARPEKLDEMMETCRKLSKSFAFVRVDLYFTSGRIYFGELTFCPTGGMKPFTPVEYDDLFGELLDLSSFERG